ncbi:N-succinylarginine dihydrolase [Erwinia sp. CGal63]|uniref:N-succinylarginine dihydrolase n=1 Tax=Erwinia sp. CGal63 TaxID=2919889 RepID=UPI003009A5BA
MSAREVNFDGLPGLTHHYAGLSFGNEASARHRHQLSNPKLAAKQGLLKMKALADMGFAQGVIPPHERPDIAALRQLGFSGTEAQVLAKAAERAPTLLSAVGSASAMWVANAATVSPSVDSADGRVHLTVANLNNKFHRSLEAPVTTAILRAIFRDVRHFCVHDALPQVAMFGDEGAANHNRFSAGYGEAGVQLFVYGREEGNGGLIPARYPARQTLEASQAVARLHQLDAQRTLFAQQNPAVIDQGVFHNDVIAVSNQQVLFCHEHAFLHQQALFDQLRERLPAFTPIVVPEARVSVGDAVATYLFNSQLLSKANGKMMLVLPEEARRHEGVWHWLSELTEGGIIDELRVFDLRESMGNGGGPACLRLRVVMNEAELAAVNPATMLTDTLFTLLNEWVDRHYRDRLCQADLADPQLLQENREALDELTKLLDLGSIYSFQR